MSLRHAVSNNIKFMADLHKQLVQKKPDQNLVMSSLSIGTLLGMILVGAEGRTAEQIEEVLYQTKADVMVGYQQLLKAVQELKLQSGFTLSMASKIYMDDNYDPEPDYVEKLKAHFQATVEQVDFGFDLDPARDQINEWMAANTGRNIVDMLSSANLFEPIGVGVTGAYFKGRWAYKFDRSRTYPADFYVTPDNPQEVNMMYKIDYFSVTEMGDLNGAMALRIPFIGNELDMIFILPKEGDNLASVEDRLKDADLSKMTYASNEEVAVTIPKFTVESFHDLRDPLEYIGMSHAMDRFNAELSGMTRRRFAVNAIAHKAMIEVNEDGDEPDATGGLVEDTREFNCNRPFMFLVQVRETGMVIMSGRIVDPSQ